MKTRIKRYTLTCQCGCRQKFKANRPDKVYKNHAHQQAAYRQRVREEEQAETDRLIRERREAAQRKREEEARKRREEQWEQSEANRAKEAERWKPHSIQVDLSATHPTLGTVYLVYEKVGSRAKWKMKSEKGKDYVFITTDGKDEHMWLLSEYQIAYKRKNQGNNGAVTYSTFRS